MRFLIKRNVRASAVGAAVAFRALAKAPGAPSPHWSSPFTSLIAVFFLHYCACHYSNSTYIASPCFFFLTPDGSRETSATENGDLPSFTGFYRVLPGFTGFSSHQT